MTPSTSVHNVNTCLRRLRKCVEVQQGRWGTIIDAEAREAAAENTFGIPDASEDLVDRCISELESAGFYRRADDGRFALVRMDGSVT